MLYYKEKNTLMVTNLKLLNDDSSKRVDVMLYRQIISSLMYLTNTRPYICFVINNLSQYIVEPQHAHLVAAKHVMRYLKGSLDYGLRYAVYSEFRLCGYIDSDWAGSAEDRKSTSRYCFSLGSGVISWIRRNKTHVSLSTAEGEYIAACSSCSEEVWLHKLLAGLFDTEMDATETYCDNQSCIKFT